ncbi:PQQ-binding-like beta-propeller repeat protein [bacterium]|nr:PQQ-binding-like beta-propeller repeat protein [bacterium]
MKQNLFSLLFTFTLTTLPLAADDWPNWMGPNHNSISSESVPKNKWFSKGEWKANVGTGFSSITIAKGKAYTMGHNGRSGSSGKETVWCLDAGSGTTVWTHTYPAPIIDRFYEGGPGASVTIRNDHAYAYSKHGHLICLNAVTGTLVWELDMMKESGLRKIPEWGFACSPTFLNDKTLLIEAGATFAVGSMDGRVKWKSKEYTPAYSSPALFEWNSKKLIAVLKSEGLVVLESVNGKTVASTPWKTSYDTSATTPIIQGNKIFISTGYQRGCALFELKGNQLVKQYENDSMSNHMSNSVLVDGYLYGFKGTAHKGPKTDLVCMNFATGNEAWKLSARSGLGCGSLIGTKDGTLVIFSERGELVRIDANPFKPKILARVQVLGGRCWTPPVLAHGRIYVRNAKGDVACVTAQ